MTGARILSEVTAERTTVEAVPDDDVRGWEVFLGSLDDKEPESHAGTVERNDDGRCGFKPALFSMYVIGPDVLRALASVVEQAEQQEVAA